MKTIYLCLLAMLATAAGCQPDNGVTGIPGPRGEPGERGPAGPPGPAGVDGNLTALYLSGTRIKAQYLLGADGSKVLHSWFDTERQEQCEWKPIEMTTEPLGCFPNKQIVVETFQSLYGDATCKKPIWAGPFPGKYLVNLETMQVYTIGATMPLGDPYYERFGSQCLFASNVYNDKFWFADAAGDVSQVWLTATLELD